MLTPLLCIRGGLRPSGPFPVQSVVACVGKGVLYVGGVAFQASNSFEEKPLGWAGGGEEEACSCDSIEEGVVLDKVSA